MFGSFFSFYHRNMFQSELCAEVNDLRAPAFYDRHVHFVDFTRCVDHCVTQHSIH